MTWLSTVSLSTRSFWPFVGVAQSGVKMLIHVGKQSQLVTVPDGLCGGQRTGRKCRFSWRAAASMPAQHLIGRVLQCPR